MTDQKKAAAGTHKTRNREAVREYEALEAARNDAETQHTVAASSSPEQAAQQKLVKKNSEQQHRLASERELMKYPNELSQLTDRMASDSWQG